MEVRDDHSQKVAGHHHDPRSRTNHDVSSRSQPQDRTKTHPRALSYVFTPITCRVEARGSARTRARYRLMNPATTSETELAHLTASFPDPDPNPNLDNLHLASPLTLRRVVNPYRRSVTPTRDGVREKHSKFS